MANSGKDTLVGLQPNGAGTWGTGVAVGATDGILPWSIDEIQLQGNVLFDDSVGMTMLQYADVLAHEANPTITIPMRWNSMAWGFVANWFGDDTDSGAGPTYTHTMNYNEETSLTGLTMALEVNNADIVEWPSLKVQQISLEPDGDGFWQMTCNCLGDTIKYGADATNAGSDFNALTYISKVQRIRYRALSLKINAQGSDPSGQTAQSVTDTVLTLARPYEQPRAVVAVATGLEKAGDEPIQNGHSEITLSFNEPTYTAIGDFDDLEDGTEKTIDLEMAETVSSQAHTMLWEFGAAHTIPASTALERGQRIPMTKNYRCIKPQSAATGQATANPIHFVLVNVDDRTYETGA
jgi:hypothetical protein